MKTKNLFFLTLIFASALSIAQSSNDDAPEVAIEQNSTTKDYEIKRFSIGLKTGIPNIASVGVQYTLPFLNNHFAPYVDYSTYSYSGSISDISGDLTFSEFGVAYYFNKRGKGLYLGAGVSSLKINAKYNDLDLINNRKGSGSAKINLNTTNFKLGLKTGGRIYFRLEVGYGLGDLPKTITVEGTDNSDPSYTGSTTEEIPEVPGISENGLVIANIGFGFSF
jgi:hypothetical protein